MKRTLIYFVFFNVFLVYFSSVYAHAQGNSWNQQYMQAQYALEKQIYTTDYERITLYCQASFDENKKINIRKESKDSILTSKRARLVWTHIVPPETFAKNFPEWNQGHAQCVDRDNTPYKGTRCVEKVHSDFRFMEADMYNIYPAVGIMAANRGDLPFALLPNEEDTEGYSMKVADGKVEPQPHARGIIARTYLYMDSVYEHFALEENEKTLMHMWNNLFPVTERECLRYQKIKSIQGNENTILRELCPQNTPS